MSSSSNTPAFEFPILPASLQKKTWFDSEPVLKQQELQDALYNFKHSQGAEQEKKTLAALEKCLLKLVCHAERGGSVQTSTSIHPKSSALAKKIDPSFDVLERLVAPSLKDKLVQKLFKEAIAQLRVEFSEGIGAIEVAAFCAQFNIHHVNKTLLEALDNKPEDKAAEAKTMNHAATTISTTVKPLAPASAVPTKSVKRDNPFSNDSDSDSESDNEDIGRVRNLKRAKTDK